MTTIEPDEQIIEDKDRDVVKRFREVVYGKEHQKQKKAKLKIFGAVMVVCCIALFLAMKNFPRQQYPATKIQMVKTEDLNRSGATAKNSEPETDHSTLKQAQLPVPDHPKIRSPSRFRIRTFPLRPRLRNM